MQIIDVSKLNAERDWIDCYVVERCLADNISRPQAYHNALQELDLCCHIGSSGSGWWQGYCHEIGTPAGVPLKRFESSSTFKSVKSSLDHAKNLLAAEKTPESRDEVNRLIQDASDGLVQIRCMAAAGFLGSFVFGVSPESVATALILIALDENVDLFLDRDAFSETYTKSEWGRIFGALPVDMEEPPNPNQLMLFKDEEPKESEFLMQGLRELRVMGPVATAWEMTGSAL